MKFWGAAYTWGKNGNPLRLERFKQLNFQLYHCCESFSSPTDHWHVFTSVKRPQCFCFVLLCLLCLFLKGGIKNVIFAKRLHFFVYFKSFIYSILHDYSAPQPSVYIIYHNKLYYYITWGNHIQSEGTDFSNYSFQFNFHNNWILCRQLLILRLSLQ